ncbi:hypothetical protein GCM10027600_04850 [Nocardioides ginsengisegetis]
MSVGAAGDYSRAVDEQAYSSGFDETSSVLTVRGEIDEVAGVALREDIAKYTREFSRPIRIDLGGVDYFPSLAVGVVAAAQRKAAAAGIDIGLVAAEGSVAQRVLTICGLPHEMS